MLADTVLVRGRFHQLYLLESLLNGHHEGRQTGGPAGSFTIPHNLVVDRAFYVWSIMKVRQGNEECSFDAGENSIHFLLYGP